MLNMDDDNEQETKLQNRDNLPDRPNRGRHVYTKKNTVQYIEIPNENNIHKYVRSNVSMTQQEIRFLAMQAITNLNELDKIDRRCDKDIMEIYIATTISQIMQYHMCICQSDKAAKSVSDDARFYLLVKSMFHRFIWELGYVYLIRYYNMIFTDDIYTDLVDGDGVQSIPIVLSEEWKAEKIKEYQTKTLQIARRKALKQPTVMYKPGRYVGARDKEGNWWMAKILKTLYEECHIIYYVEFLNWGDQFNEFITDVSRIQKYNPRRHKLFEPVEV